MANTCQEIWVTIEEYPNYMVSNFGRVKSIDRKNINSLGVKSFIRGVMLNPRKNETGYLRVALSIGNNKFKNYRVHRLVADHFIDNDNHLRTEVNHKDGDKSNNHFENLEWCTHKENMSHYFKLINHGK